MTKQNLKVITAKVKQLQIQQLKALKGVTDIIIEDEIVG